MGSVFDKLLWKIGFYGPIPSPPARPGIEGPYAYLHDLPRYQPATLQLDDHLFDIADGFSFYWMHKEIYRDKIYSFRPQRDSPLIIDCGASYGVSVAWFKRYYPDARIVAVEADPDIYAILQRNIERRALGSITLLHKAVAEASGTLPFQCIGADSGRLNVGAANGATTESPVVHVETIRLDDLIADEYVDFLKVDIEGAEASVICSCGKLDRVSQMFIEYHSFINAPQQLSSLLSVLEKSGFRYYINRIFAPANPYLEITHNQSMDLQLGIFATRV